MTVETRNPKFFPGIRRTHNPIPFNPEDPTSTLPDYRRFHALPRLDFMNDYTYGDLQTLRRIAEELGKGVPLDEIGRGEDMAAYSRADLNFIVKFPYDDSTWQPTTFNYRMNYGYSISKEYLGELFVPSMDVYGKFTNYRGEEQNVLAIVQHKVQTVAKVLSQLRNEGNEDRIKKVKQDFLDFNRRAWELGILDADSNWEENYGYMSDGSFRLIDFGRITDDPAQFAFFEGLPRTSQYERDLRDYFTNENFMKFFGSRTSSRTRSSNPK
ncbi:MAG TPA: hypothetical protein VG965_05795 [Patescibacteria group bacterium]|nr:hypothetical protein [Patescibacteria group bacterium]